MPARKSATRSSKTSSTAARTRSSRLGPAGLRLAKEVAPGQRELGKRLEFEQLAGDRDGPAVRIDRQRRACGVQDEIALADAPASLDGQELARGPNSGLDAAGDRGLGHEGDGQPVDRATQTAPHGS